MPGTDTLLLDRTTWDLVIDAAGNIAQASAPYSLAQDAASAIQTYQGEVFWDTTLGVPWLTQILAKRPPLSLLKAQLQSAAASVPGVSSAKCFVSNVDGRRVSGQVQVVPTGSRGQSSAATFQVVDPQGV